MITFLRKPFYIHISNSVVKPVSLSIFMLVSFASSIPKFFIHASDDVLYMLRDEISALVLCNKAGTDPTINEVGYETPERRNKAENECGPGVGRYSEGQKTIADNTQRMFKDS